MQYLPEEEPNGWPQREVEVKSYKRKTTSKKKVNRNYKRILIKYALIASVIIGSLYYATYKVNEWFTENTLNFRSPVIFQMPVQVLQIRHNEGDGALIKEAEAKEIDFTGADFISRTQEVSTEKIFQLESSSGKNDGCVTKGLGFNGYGYRQNKNEWKCFGSYEEVEGYVQWQFDKYFETMDLATALCYYNTGTKVNDCKYYQDYLKLN